MATVHAESPPSDFPHVPCSRQAAIQAIGKPARDVLDAGNDRLAGFRRVSVAVDVTGSARRLRLGASERSLPAHGWPIEST